jgi:hypothetical protein
LIARTQLAGRNAAQHLVDDLAVHGNAAALIESELEPPDRLKSYSQVIVY